MDETGKTAAEGAPRTRRFRKRRFSRVPRMPVPVRALWERASEEERKRAHETCSLLLELWLGRATRAEAAARLKVAPLRLWQMSQQALAGMVAGCLRQPRARGKAADPGADEPTALRRRLLELEREAQAKDSLIALLREMPAHRATPREEGAGGNPHARGRRRKGTAGRDAGWRDNPDLAAKFTGRRVYVFGSAERHEGPTTRSEDENHYEVTVIVLERYTAQAADVPAEWMDERVAWVEREVFDRLGDARETENPVVASADPVSQEWVQVYSPDLLLSLRLFRSEVRVVYRKIEDTRPT